MMMFRTRSGFSLLETMVVGAVFMVVLAAMFTALTTAQDSAHSSAETTQSTEQAKRIVQRIASELEESGLGTVDCQFRYRTEVISAQPTTPAYPAPYPSKYTITNAYDYSYTKYYQGGYGRQCTSYHSPWTRHHGSGQPHYPRAQLAERRYTNSALSQPYVWRYGRIWPETYEKCPLDGGYMIAGGYYGGLRFFTPRDASGAFVTEEYSALEAKLSLRKKPDWQGMVFYLPFKPEGSEVVELRRYVIYRDDLLTQGSHHRYHQSREQDWTAWDGNLVRDGAGMLSSGLPTLVDLFDFGTNGTPDGKPDGSIPRTPEQADSHYEYYMAYAGNTTSTGAYAYAYWLKYYYDQPSGTYRHMYLRLDRKTGEVYWKVYFANNEFGQYWYRYAVFTRKPEVVARHLVGCDFSTRLSNPYDATANPGGVSSGDVVRITLAFDRPRLRRGSKQFNESVQTIQVSPRNY